MDFIVHENISKGNTMASMFRTEWLEMLQGCQPGSKCGELYHQRAMEQPPLRNITDHSTPRYHFVLQHCRLYLFQFISIWFSPLRSGCVPWLSRGYPVAIPWVSRGYPVAIP